VDAAVVERQPIRGGADRGGQIARSLRGHQVARLDGDHVAVARLVGARSGPHVDHGARLAQRRDDALEEARVLAARAGIALSNAIVARPGSGGHGPTLVDPCDAVNPVGCIPWRSTLRGTVRRWQDGGMVAAARKEYRYA